MGTSRAVDVSIIGHNESLKRSLQETEGHLKSLQRTAHTAAFGFAAFFVGGQIERGLKAVVGASLEAQKDTKLLSTIVNNAGISWKKHGEAIDGTLKKMGLAKGFMQGELKDAMEKMLVATHSQSKSFKDIGLAMDLARQRGLSLSQSSILVARASEGNVTSLKRLGIMLPKITTQQDALRKAHDKGVIAGGKYSKAQEVEYRQALKIAQANDKQATAVKGMAVLQKTFGGSAKAFAGTDAGKLDKFHAATQQLEVELGNVLIPLLGKAADYFSHLIEGAMKSKELKRVLHEIGQAVQSAFGTLITILKQMVSWGGKIFSEYQKHPELFKTLASAIFGMAVAIKTVTIATKLLSLAMALTPFGAVVLAISGLIGALVYLNEHNKTVHRIIQEVWGWIRDNIPPIVTRVEQVIRAVWGRIEPYVKTLWNSVVGIFKGFWTFIQGWYNLITDIFHGRWGKLWGDVKQIVSGAWEAIKSDMEGLPKVLGELGLKAGLAIYHGVVNGIKSIPSAIAHALVGGSAGTKYLPGSAGGTTSPRTRPGAATGAWVAGSYGAGDRVPAMLAGGEAVLNPTQIDMVGRDRVMGALHATGAPTIGSGGAFSGGATPNFDWNHPSFGGGKKKGSHHGRKGPKPPPPPDPAITAWLSGISTWVGGHTPKDIAKGTIDFAQSVYETVKGQLNKAGFFHPKNPDQRTQLSDAKHRLHILDTDAHTRYQGILSAGVPGSAGFQQHVGSLENKLTVDRNKKKPAGTLSGDKTNIRKAYAERLKQLQKLLSSTKNATMRSMIMREIAAAKKGVAWNTVGAAAVTDPYGIDALNRKIGLDDQTIAMHAASALGPDGNPLGVGSAGDYATAITDTNALIAKLQSDIGSGKFKGDDLDTLNQSLTGAYGTLSGYESAASGLNAAGVITPDAQAQIDQLNRQLGVANYGRNLSDAALSVFDGSGDIGMGGNNALGAASGGPNINIYTLHPGDPQTLAAIGAAATSGQALQPFITSPRSSVNI